jgi:hypothetical protein
MVDLTHEQKWRFVSLGSAVLAAVVVRGGIKALWKATRDDEPPVNPMKQDSTWTDALLFSLATGLSVGLARLGARAIAASTWERQTRPHLPSWTR